MKKASKPKSAKQKRKRMIHMKKVNSAMSGLGSVVQRALDEGERMNPDDHVDDLRGAVEELQSAVEGFKREIKRRMLKDGILETQKSNHVHAKLILKPGRRKGSRNPDDYDMEVERIH